MNSSSGTLQDSVNLFFWLLIYVPLNIFSIVITATLFSLTNRFLHLQFPVWALAIGAALLVFVVTVNLLTSTITNYALFYSTTVVINSIAVFFMVTLTGITRFVFGGITQSTFVFEKPQLIAISVYACITGVFALLPLFEKSSDYLTDIQNESKLSALEKIINTNDVERFAEIQSRNVDLWNVKLPNTPLTLIEYLVSKDKVDMVVVLVKADKNLFTYALDWPIKSKAMVDLLIKNGMNSNQVVDELSASNKTDLINYTVEKYNPDFRKSVSYITQNILQNKNITLFAYLLKNGLAKDTLQNAETIYSFIQKQDIETVIFLLENGFRIDTSDKRLVYLAIINDNLPLLTFLLNYQFDINAYYDEYTYLETAIISNRKAIFDLLLTRQPDIATLHITKLNGETNALRIAEKYQRADMLDTLKRYVDSKK
ncbi:hypothetical protein GCM10028807_12330 [Spirosoma daeguense]